MSEEVRVSGDGVFEMESLIREVNRIIIKAKFTVNRNSTAVQKVVNVTDDQGALENVADQLTVLEEGCADRGAERVTNITERDVGGGGGVAGAGAVTSPVLSWCRAPTYASPISPPSLTVPTGPLYRLYRTNFGRCHDLDA
jgi:hypothetical protein